MTTKILEQCVETLNNDEEPILCMIDNVKFHSTMVYFTEKYPNTWTWDQYVVKYLGAPISFLATAKFIEEPSNKGKNKKDRSSKCDNQGNSGIFFPKQLQRYGFVCSDSSETQQNFYGVFQLGNAKLSFSSDGNPILILILNDHTDIAFDYLLTSKDDFVYNADLLKDIIVSFEINVPIYLWGMYSTNKTTILQEIADRTDSPFCACIAIMNIQQGGVLDQWIVNAGSDCYRSDPSIIAMINGWAYCADEYDLAMPSVSTVYQAGSKVSKFDQRGSSSSFLSNIAASGTLFCGNRQYE